MERPKNLSGVALGLRFFLELAALAAMAFWGFVEWRGWVNRLLFGLGMPLLAAAAWGIFRVDGDPKKAPVRVPGMVRLLLEIAYFGLGVWCLYAAAGLLLAAAFAFLVLINYHMLWDRVEWLVHQ